MMKYYLELNHYPNAQGAVHGRDYHKGLEDGRECGRVHEFTTRNCQPIIYTEEELGNMLEKHPEWYVEVVSLRGAFHP